MIETIKKLAEIWKAIPVLPRRVMFFGGSTFVFIGGSVYLYFRAKWVQANPDVLENLTLFQFLGF